MARTVGEVFKKRFPCCISSGPVGVKDATVKGEDVEFVAFNRLISPGEQGFDCNLRVPISHYGVWLYINQADCKEFGTAKVKEQKDTDDQTKNAESNYFFLH